MVFTTSCFVRVENPAERQELIEWLKSIDRQRVPHSKRDRAPIFTAYMSGRYEQNNSYYHQPTQAVANGFIDCGANVELFKALAAMNDSNDREQWYYCLVTLGISAEGFEGAEPTICWSGTIAHRDDDRVFDLKFWRKATAEEIIEHFTNV